ncbi:MAG TPA: PIN domain-containing protein [Planctomycetota bacterium]
MIFVDTGYLIAIATPTDNLHARAVGWSRSVKDTLLTTEYVLWECVNHFSCPVDRPKVHALLRSIRQSSQFEILDATAALSSEALQYHKAAADKFWSLTDCVSFIAMRERQITQALAHDRHFEQAGFEALLRRDP